MYCKEHERMIRCNSLQQSNCGYCKEPFTTYNAPPLNTLCKECSRKLNKCEYCGATILDKGIDKG